MDFRYHRNISLSKSLNESLLVLLFLQDDHLRACIHKNCYPKAMIRKPYDTDLTDHEWAMIEPYFSKHRTYKWSKR